MVNSKFANVLALSACFAVGSLQANEQLQLSLAGGHESNVSRGFDEPHRLSSGYVSTRLQASKLFQLGLNDSLSLGITFGSRSYGELGGFDQLLAEFSGSWHHKFGLGAYAPQFSAAVSVGRVAMRGAARDRDIRSLDLNLSKRFSPAWSFFGRASVQSFEAETLPYNAGVSQPAYAPYRALSYSLYDFTAKSASVGADYTFANGIMLIGEYQRINGYTVSSTHHPDMNVYQSAAAFYLDPAFANSWYAYRLESNTDAYGLTLSLPLAPDTAVDVMAGWFDIAAPGGKQYDNSEVSVGITWGF